MHFLGRWVPMEVMDTIFVLWAIAALAVAVGLFWSIRAARPTRSSRSAAQGVSRKKRNMRKKRS